MSDNWDIERPTASTQRAYLCPVCSGPVNVVDKFCRHCGARFDEPEAGELLEEETAAEEVATQPSLLPLILTAGGAVILIVSSFSPQVSLSGPQAALFSAQPGTRGEFRFSGPRWWWQFLILWVPCATATGLAAFGALRASSRTLFGAALLGLGGLLAFERMIRTLAQFATFTSGFTLTQEPSWASYAGIGAAVLMAAGGVMLLVTKPHADVALIEAPDFDDEVD